MHLGKRLIAGILTTVITVGIFVGCSNNLRSDDGNTLTMNFCMSDKEEFVIALQKAFPDIQFEIEHYRGINGSEYCSQILTNGDVPDIYVANNEPSHTNQKEYLLDMSGFEFVSNYHVNVLSQIENDGGVYVLPTSMGLRTMVYNKTLFEEKGWEKATNHRELVALVEQIREESEITPIAFFGKDEEYFFTYMTTLSQCSYLTTTEGKAWEERYLAGEASAEEGFAVGIELLQDLIDANAFDVEKYTHDGDVAVTNKFVKERDAAMMAVWTGQSYLTDLAEESTDEFALFPFYGAEDGEVFIGTAPGCYFGMSNRLAEKGNEKKLENAIRVMEWICSKQGLPYLRSSEEDICPLAEPVCVSPKGMYQDVWDEHSNGYKAPILYTGYTDIISRSGECIRDAMLNQGSLDGLTQMIDETHQKALENTFNYGEIAEDFTIEETAQLQVNILNSLGIADFAMISVGGSKNGVSSEPTGSNGKLYAGRLTPATINVVTPRGRTVCTLELTGKQIRELIEKGKETEGTFFDYFWSGIDVKMKKGKVVSMQIDGRKVEPQKTYTVAFGKDDYGEDIGADAVDTEIVYFDIFQQYILENSPVKVPKVLRKQHIVF